MITRGLNTGKLITRGYGFVGIIVSGYHEIVTFIFRVATVFKVNNIL